MVEFSTGNEAPKGNNPSTAIIMAESERKLAPVGFSTGCFYLTHDPVAHATIEMVRSLGATAIEFSPQTLADLMRIRDTISYNDLHGFEHISLHPKKISFRAETIRDAIAIIADIYDAIGCQVVVHPNEVSDLKLLAKVRFPLLFENMDARNTSYLHPEDFEDLFTEIPAGLVLDINHCYTNDNSLALVDRFIAHFEDRLSEIHLSGHKTFHEALFETGQNEILHALPLKPVPIIIESGCTSIELARNEIDLVRGFLAQREKGQRVAGRL